MQFSHHHVLMTLLLSSFSPHNQADVWFSVLSVCDELSVQTPSLKCECPVCVRAPLGGSIVTTTDRPKVQLQPALLLCVLFCSEERRPNLEPLSLPRVLHIDMNVILL